MLIFIPAHTHDKGSQNITGSFTLSANLLTMQSTFITGADLAFRHYYIDSAYNRAMMPNDSSLFHESHNEDNYRHIQFNANNAGAWTGVTGKTIYLFLKL